MDLVLLGQTGPQIPVGCCSFFEKWFLLCVTGAVGGAGMRPKPSTRVVCPPWGSFVHCLFDSAVAVKPRFFLVWIQSLWFFKPSR